MTIETRSVFYYGHVIDDTNPNLPFSEGGPEINAVLNLGDYTLAEFTTEVARAMNDIGGQIYTVAVNRDTRIITISAPGTFELLVSTGSTIGTGVYSLIGFTGADRTAAITYAGDSASGEEFTPQFYLQDWIASEDFVNPTSSVVNTSAAGDVEVVTFSDEYFFEFNIKFQTDNDQGFNAWIETDLSGVSNFRAFMVAIIKRTRFEIMRDRDTRSSFEKIILQKTPLSSQGTGFKLLENKRIKGYFDSGKLTFKDVTAT